MKDKITFQKNGKLIYKNQFLNGKQHGEQLGYDYNGQLCHKYQYINDKEVSKKEWLDYSKPQHQTQFLTDMYV